MNDKPDTKGIERRWVPGEDDRALLATYSGLRPRQVDDALDGLWRLLASRPRTKFVGFGVFEWKRWCNRIPTGRKVSTWRLAFKPSRYVPCKYKGGRKR